MVKSILYSFRRCPYAMRARWAIILSGKQVELREVSLKNKPKELKDISNKATVPVLLKANGEIIEESLDIIYWAIENLSNEEAFILKGKDNENHVRELIQENDNEFKFHLDRYKYHNRYKNTNSEHHFTQAQIILEKWDNLLGGKPYSHSTGWLIGNNETIADWSLWPFVRQYRSVNPIRFDNDRNLSNLKKWLNYYLNHDYISILMSKYKCWERSDKSVLFPSISR